MQLELLTQPTTTQPQNHEQWLTVSGFPRYEVSSLGRFRRKSTGKLLGGNVVHNGYLHIGLLRNGTQITKLAHRLVAETFLQPASDQHCVVNHINKVRTDNQLSNLEWSTRSHNARHAKQK